LCLPRNDRNRLIIGLLANFIQTGNLRLLKESKTSIRKEMLRMRDRLAEESIKAMSARIAGRLIDLEEYRKSRNILFFLSLPREVQTREMIEKSLALGKKVYVPVMDAARKTLEISQIPSLDIEFEAKQFGVLEPGPADQKITSPSVIDFVLVPGLAFDRKGGRIGYGAGYYDSFLREVGSHAARVGVAFHFQVLKTVPQSGADVPVQKILTEKVTISC